MNKLLYIVLLTVFVTSCSQYQKALKSEDITTKYTQAAVQYDAGKYSKAIRLFEQVAPAYRGKPEAEKMFYMFSQSYYKTRQYHLAAYQFESFASLYPKSQYTEEAYFLAAESYSKLSPEYSLDQVDTEKGITKTQEFINNYPNSKYLDQANAIVKGLTQKLEKKAFQIAKQYHTISDYKAAIKALEIFLGEFPGTQYKEDALYYRLDASYQLAINSIPSKMEERLKVAKTAHQALIKHNANTQYIDIATKMATRLDTELQKFEK